MANLYREGLLSGRWQPLVQSLRNRRVNVQRPRAPHYDRARVLALLQPQYAEDKELYQPPALTCKKIDELQRNVNRPDNPLEKIIAREMFEKFEKSNLIAFFHQNITSGEDAFDAKIKFKREKMDPEVYSKHTAKIALQGTHYEQVLNLFVAHNIIVTSKEPNVAKLLKVAKKIPNYILMAAIVEGRLLNMSSLVAYAQYKDITQARAQLVGTLNAAGMELVSRLTQPQNTLVSQLGELAKIKEGGGS